MMAINVSVQHNQRRVSPRYNTVDPMLLPSRNLFKCHEDVLYLQPMIPPKRFDIFFPLTEECSGGLDVLRFIFKSRRPMLMRLSR